MNFSDKAFNACADLAKELGRRLTVDEWKATVQTAFERHMAEAQKAEESVKPAKISAREQAELFNALSMACNHNPLECSPAMKKTIAVALSDIRGVTPGLTAEEIHRRAREYKRKHKDWPLTPSSLAKYWGEFGQADLGRTFAAKTMLEPPGWQTALREVMPDSDAATISYMISSLGWNKLGSDLKEAIRRRTTTDTV